MGARRTGVFLKPRPTNSLRSAGCPLLLGLRICAPRLFFTGSVKRRGNALAIPRRVLRLEHRKRYLWRTGSRGFSGPGDHRAWGPAGHRSGGAAARHGMNRHPQAGDLRVGHLALFFSGRQCSGGGQRHEWGCAIKLWSLQEFVP